ncbi:hypothetical protein H113_08832 [Trichophyton rubrum MR1459]|nr:hypothetical protein H113_08832 [Trichophyton rubrum MR1459]KMQ42673.1 hypothetical protein HL42_6640 [Trichophyton rubrum]
MACAQDALFHLQGLRCYNDGFSVSDGLEKGLIHKQPRQENLSGYFFEPFNGSSMLSRLWMDNLDKSRRSKFNNGPGYRGMYQADDKLCLGSAAEVVDIAVSHWRHEVDGLARYQALGI